MISFTFIFRVFFIGAQDGNFPMVLSMINYKFLTPAPAIVSTVSRIILLNTFTSNCIQFLCVHVLTN